MPQTRTFEKRLDSVDRKVDLEPWHDDHAKAMACRDLEDALRAELALYREIEDLDAEMRLSWAKGAAYSAPTERRIEDVHHRWVKRNAPLLAVIRRYRREFGEVEGADEFLRVHREAKSVSDELSEDSAREGV
jgi:hypothetical protein